MRSRKNRSQSPRDADEQLISTVSCGCNCKDASCSRIVNGSILFIYFIYFLFIYLFTQPIPTI